MLRLRFALAVIDLVALVVLIPDTSLLLGGGGVGGAGGLKPVRHRHTAQDGEEKQACQQDHT
jgi:hypothetical protein